MQVNRNMNRNNKVKTYKLSKMSKREIALLPIEKTVLQYDYLQ